MTDAYECEVRIVLERDVMSDTMYRARLPRPEEGRIQGGEFYGVGETKLEAVGNLLDVLRANDCEIDTAIEHTAGDSDDD